MKLTAHIPPTVRLEEVCAAMRSLGLELRYRDGDLIAGNPEQHGNANVVRMQKYRRQLLGVTPPGPDVA